MNSLQKPLIILPEQLPLISTVLRGNEEYRVFALNNAGQSPPSNVVPVVL